MLHLDQTLQFELGVPILDVQLRELSGAVSRLFSAVMEGRDLEAIRPLICDTASTANFHFAMEERMMDRHGYEHLEDHVKHHKQFGCFVEDVECFLASGEVGRAKDAASGMKSWLHDHVRKSDKLFAECILEDRAA